MRRLRHKVGLAAPMLAALLTISACGTPASLPTGEVTFGAIIGQSGIYGANAPGFIAGVKVAADKINAGSGIVADGKKLTVKMLILDDRSDPQAAAAAAIQMIRDNNIKVIFGPLAVAAASVAPISNENKVINVTACSCAQALKPGDTPYPMLFYRQPTDAHFAGVAVSAAKKFYPQAKSLAIMAPVVGSNQLLNPLLTAGFEAAGVKVLNFSYPAGTADLSTIATKVAAAKPDIVWATTSVQEVTNVMRSLDAAGVPKTVPVFSQGGDVSAQANGRPVVVFISNAFDAARETSPDVAKFKEAIIAKNGGPIEIANIPPAQYYYFAMQLIAKAMTKANTTTDTAAIAREMTNVSLDEFGGHFQWNATDHHMSYPLAIVSYSSTGQPTVEHLSPPK